MTRPLRARILSAVALATALFAHDVASQAPVSGAAEVGVRNRYLVAGLPFAEGAVTHARAHVAGSGFLLGGLAVYDHELGALGEADIFGEVGAALGSGALVSAGLAINNFNFVDEWETTAEAYVVVSLIAPLQPSLMVAHDFDIGDGGHALLSLRHDVDLGVANVGVSSHLDYSRGYYSNVSGLSFGDVGLDVSIPLGRVTLIPFVSMQRAIAGELDDQEVFGVSGAIDF